MLAWLVLVGTLSRVKVATLLSNPGIGLPDIGIAAETGVLPRSFNELTSGSGVWIAR
jgi:hypothetical protein